LALYHFSTSPCDAEDVSAQLDRQAADRLWEQLCQEWPDDVTYPT